MKLPNFLFTVVASLSVNFTISAQQSSSSTSAMSANFCLIKMFGTNNCTARCDVRILNDSFKESATEGFALLDGKTRQEMDISQFKAQMLPPAAARQMGIDQQVIILRPDLKLAYNIYPRLKSYVVRSLPKNDAAAQGKELTMEVTEFGHENVDGHPCAKKKFVVTTGDGERHEILAWLASDLKDFPVKTQVTDDGSIEITTYKEIQFIAPDAKLFEPPAGFTKYAGFEEMMDQTQTNGAAGFDTNAVSTDNDRIISIVDFTLKKGTNRPVGPATVKAFGLGDEKIPATQLILSRKGETLVYFFGVSAQNSNDLFVACIDQKTRGGTVWLTSRSGEIRATVLTSSNSPPKVVANESHADEFAEEINLFLEFVTPPPWEDAPHPLNVVAKFGDVSDVEKILKRDPKAINTQDDEGMTPLAGAVVQEQVDVVRFLLDKGADPNIPNKNGLTPLEHACGRDKTNALALAKLLLAKGALINATNMAGFTIPPLEWAISSDNTELVKLLLDHGADVTVKSDVGSTPLHSAADRGDLEIADILIAHGADVNAKITGGTTPLHEAAWNGHDDIVKLLLSKGAETDPKLTTGITPLFSAAGPGGERSGKACVEILLAHGADINVTDENGNTLLHTAAYYGNKEVIEVLLAHGEAVNVKNKRGETPLQIAANSQHPAIVELLHQHGAKE
ncbi:MAG TPA: ankyrin repeat domain-containing protein [Verrucomicrobiae bacterium]|nr:ankyrin repeat domain-containing protein [Verrucomicrobiae bacterium]